MSKFGNLAVYQKLSKQFASEAVAWRCSVKKVFLKISQNSWETTCAKVFFKKIKLQA